MTHENRLSICLILFATLVSCSSQISGITNDHEPAPAQVQPAGGGDVTPTPTPTPERVEQINTDPAKLAVAFYEYYVDGFPQVDDERVIFSRYLTPRFFDQALKAEGYDIFLDAQDFDSTWRNNVSASNKLISGNRATVNINLKGETFKWVLKVSLLKRNGTWKIDGVKGLN